MTAGVSRAGPLTCVCGMMGWPQPCRVFAALATKAALLGVAMASAEDAVGFLISKAANGCTCMQYNAAVHVAALSRTAMLCAPGRVTGCLGHNLPLLVAVHTCASLIDPRLYWEE